jgi:hypothetical protein
VDHEFKAHLGYITMPYIQKKKKKRKEKLVGKIKIFPIQTRVYGILCLYTGLTGMAKEISLK